jgi:hypothetical protein
MIKYPLLKLQVLPFELSLLAISIGFYAVRLNDLSIVIVDRRSPKATRKKWRKRERGAVGLPDGPTTI